MKRWESLAVDHCKRYSRAWDYAAAAMDAFNVAYKHAREDVNREQLKNVLFNPLEAGEELVEVEFKDGEHSLAAASFTRWKQENSSLSLQEAMTTYLKMFNINDIRVVESNGVISFQGTCTRKQEFSSSVVVQD